MQVKELEIEEREVEEKEKQSETPLVLEEITIAELAVDGICGIY